jgi:hypothetical protein
LLFRELLDLPQYALALEEVPQQDNENHHWVKMKKTTILMNLRIVASFSSFF